jgi:hypothetical protein
MPCFIAGGTCIRAWRWHNCMITTIQDIAYRPDFCRFEVCTAVTMKNAVFWDVTPRGSCKNWRFGWTSLLHDQGEKNQRVRNNVSCNYFTLMMEVMRSSKTTVLIRVSRRHILEDGILHRPVFYLKQRFRNLILCSNVDPAQLGPNYGERLGILLVASEYVPFEDEDRILSPKLCFKFREKQVSV